MPSVRSLRGTSSLRPALSVLLLCSAAVADGNPVALKPGPWRAWLDCPGGELPFDLELTRNGARWRATIANGQERIPIPMVSFDGTELTLGIDYYDSTITARVSADGTRIDGAWRKKGRGDAWTTLPFHAMAGEHPRFPRDESHEPGPRGAGGRWQFIDGRWAVDFSSSEEPAVGIFEQHEGGTVTGTFLTTTGDYRYLAGAYENGRLRLSAFDGAHAFLFDARCGRDGTLQGDFWSRDAWHETWTAKHDPKVRLPDAFAISRATGRVDLSALSFPDLSGNPRSLNDPAFAGKARIIEVFGSWCPNCHDASAYLVELDGRYRDRGLSIVGLAFELTGDFRRDARQVRTYVERHRIEYPVLIAGPVDKEKAAKALPMLDGLRAYPTTMFLDAAGNVRAVHTGFAGPATGDAHRALRREFERIIDELLEE